MGVCRHQNKTMDMSRYLNIENPLERLAIVSKEIHQSQAEIIELSRIRNAAIIEAYENKIHPRDICEAGNFNLSRLRAIMKNAKYVKPHDFRENSKATQFKKEY